MEFVNIEYKIFDVDIVIVMKCSDCNTRYEHCYVTYKKNLEMLKISGQTKILTNGLIFKNNFEYIDDFKEKKDEWNAVLKINRRW